MPFIKKHQTFFDAIAQHCGDMENTWDVVRKNGISITDEPVPGSLMEVPIVTAPKVTNYFIRENINIATRDNPFANTGGIGYMKIQTDFKVS